MATRPAVYVVDDDAAVRDALAFSLATADLDPRTFDSGAALLAAMPLAPGCIVTDVRMPEMSGIDLVRRLRQLDCALPVVVITGHADVPLAIEAMKAGVAEFLEKPFDDDVLIGVVQRLLEEQVPLQRELAEKENLRQRLSELSARERDVLDGLMAGRANKVIAYDLGISPRTVEVYRANLMKKMAARSLSELVRMALAASSG
ncbi:MAG: response regulator [Caulobacter sp.]|jgi:two-component system response regulator FixJ|nr:response regulator [Caulobacter sp.]